MTINRKSILVQSSTGSTMNITTDKVEGDSYYGYSDGMHTIAIQYYYYAPFVSSEETTINHAAPFQCLFG